MANVRKIEFRTDEMGDYIPVCTYKYHIGVIDNPRKCERRDCNYYLKFRAESPTRRGVIRH